MMKMMQSWKRCWCHSKPERLLLLYMLCVNFLSTSAKTVSGVLTTNDARESRGQYITSFAYQGNNAQFIFHLNTTGHTAPKFYFFLDDDWFVSQYYSDCQLQLEKARIFYEAEQTQGNKSLPHFPKPRIWHIVYADEYTCSGLPPDSVIERPNYLAFTLQLLNPDSLGNPTDHFSREESGLYRFYQLLTLIYFILACICGPRLSVALHKEGPMHFVILLLTVAMGFQAFCSLFMVLHLRQYSFDGIGRPIYESFAEFLDVCSQFVMLYMLLCVSMGWTLSGSYKPTHVMARIKDKPLSKVVAVIAVLQLFLFIWEQFEHRTQPMYHAHRSTSGMALIWSRILVAGYFTFKLRSSISKERSALKREFYDNFSKTCWVWFLCYPLLLAISYGFSAYLRYKLVTMSVIFCQSVTVIFLYRLFLSRSLYWEVSALSSSILPLRMDKTLNMKLYS